MRRRKKIDPTRVPTPVSRSRNGRRTSDYADAENLGAFGLLLLLLAIVGLAIFRVVTGAMWP